MQSLKNNNQSIKPSFTTPYLSIVSPVYHSENLLYELAARLSSTLETISENFEILLVDDGSTDQSWLKIERLSEQDPRIKGIKLSRNFGQHSAITAGLEQARGEWIVVMDCDLQDQPEEIPALLTRALQGYDVVLGSRQQRKDSFFKRFLSKCFYQFLSFVSGTQYDFTIANFGIYHRNVISSIVKMPEKIRFFPAMINWVGFRKTILSIKHAPRAEGKSSYNFKKRLKLALEIILTYSNKPLRLIVYLGFIVSLFSFVLGCAILYKYFSGQINLLGYASVFVSICFFSGLIIFVLGIIGLYIGKIFEGIKNRPNYLIEKTTRDHGKNTL